MPQLDKGSNLCRSYFQRHQLSNPNTPLVRNLIAFFSNNLIFIAGVNKL